MFLFWMAIFHVVPLKECIFLNIKFARVCRHVQDFNARNKCVTVTLFKQDLMSD